MYDRIAGKAHEHTKKTREGIHRERKNVRPAIFSNHHPYTSLQNNKSFRKERSKGEKMFIFCVNQ